MEKFHLKNNDKMIHVVKWNQVNKTDKVLIIVHGMAEHIKRYDYFATKLNENNILVYGYEVIGHGSTIKKKEDQGHWNKGDFDNNVDNINQLISYVKKEHPNLKVFLLGHSMGSFLTRRYLIKYGSNINGALLSGSSAITPLMKMGATISKLFSKKKDKLPNHRLTKLSFGSYNKHFKPNRTEFDWLSSDNAQVDKYIEDPLCGFVCTTGYYKEFTSSLKHLDDKVNLRKIPKELPIYIFSGSLDPVSNMGKDIKKLYLKLLNAGLKNVYLKVYQNMRHETLNEVDKDIVINDVINWVNKQ